MCTKQIPFSQLKYIYIGPTKLALNLTIKCVGTTRILVEKFFLKKLRKMFNTHNGHDIISSRPSDHYFRGVCLSVCLFVCAEFFSAVFDPIWIKLGHMLHVRV